MDSLTIPLLTDEEPPEAFFLPDTSTEPDRIPLVTTFHLVKRWWNKLVYSCVCSPYVKTPQHLDQDL
jgi:hypothetical protein